MVPYLRIVLLERLKSIGIVNHEPLAVTGALVIEFELLQMLSLPSRGGGSHSQVA